MTERLTALVVIALCVVGLGLAAATLSSGIVEQSGNENGSANGSVGSGVGDAQSGAGSSVDTTVPSWVINLIVVVAAGSVLATVYFYRGRAVAVGVLVLLLGAVAVGLIWLSDPGTPSLGQPDQPLAVNGTDEPNESAPGASEDGSPPLALFGVVGAVLTVAAVAAVYASRSVDDSEDLLEDPDDDPDPEAVADAAGRAADMIEDTGRGDLSNAVYEAWTEMTEAVDVANPDAATPQEFAGAAVAAGADPAPVDELTDVFEAVRYGDDPAEWYETQAVTALRRIEDGLSVEDDLSVGSDVAAGTDAGETRDTSGDSPETRDTSGDPPGTRDTSDDGTDGNGGEGS